MISESIFDLAYETAESSPSKTGGCFFNKNRVVVTATNLETKSHPMQAKFAERADCAKDLSSCRDCCSR